MFSSAPGFHYSSASYASVVNVSGMVRLSREPPTLPWPLHFDNR